MMKIISIDMIIDAIKVIENNETRWILLNDKKDIDEMLNKLLKTLNILYIDKNDDDNDLILNERIHESHFYYDSNNKCLKSRIDIKKNTFIFNERSMLYCNENEIQAFDNAVKPLVLKTIIRCSNNMNKDDVTKIYQFFIPSSHLALLSSFSKLSYDEQKEVLSLSKPQEIPNTLYEALHYFIELVLNDSKLQCISLRRQYSVDTLVSLLLIFSTNVFGTHNNGEFEFVALFKYGCRLNHSCCSSNTTWKIGNNDNINNNSNILTFISTTDIHKGEELTQCYFDRERWYPTHLRKKLLQESRFFNCNCFECKKKIDEKRNFYCPSCRSLSSLVILENNSLNCKSCNHIPHNCENIFTIEKLCEDIVMDLVNDPSEANFENIQHIYSNFTETGPLHWTNCEISDYLQSQYTSSIKRIGLIYRRIKSLQYNSKSITTNIEISAIISYIEMAQKLLKKDDYSLIDIKDFIQKEISFILKVNNIEYTEHRSYDNHHIVFLLLVHVSLQNFLIY